MSVEDVSSLDESAMDEDNLQEIYSWIDELPLSRPKRNITRDFSDGVMVAECIHHFCPKLVEMHNYSAANSTKLKQSNWDMLKMKAFARLNYNVSESLIKNVISCKPGAVEIFLHGLRMKIDIYLAKKKAASLGGQHKVYDEFSPEGPIATYPQDPSAAYNSNMYYGNEGYPYNAGPPQYAMMPGQALQGPSHAAPAMPVMMAQPLVEGDMQSKVSPGKTKGEHLPRATLPEKKKANKGGDKVGRAQSYQDFSENSQTLRLALEEKEQSLLASQETVQILQVKIRRLEHLLHLKDTRIDDLTRRLMQQQPPRQLPPQQFPFQPPLQDVPPMYHMNPLPPLQNHSSQPSANQEDGIKI